MARLDLVTPKFVQSNAAHLATVNVVGGAPGRTVQVGLHQVRGVGPLGEWTPATVTLDQSGSATAVFTDLRLEGPTTAVILAIATDELNGFYRPDAECIVVTG